MQDAHGCGGAVVWTSEEPDPNTGETVRVPWLQTERDADTTSWVVAFGGVTSSWVAISHDVSEPVGTSEYPRLK